ncbi:Amino acid transporter [Operophtera brumata]|uniref:Amino acid transporter n=1 Tax=Operophtera brumata TaxID=104452 RepID=A0A0L7LRI5_OPEBR|nr:Amino acid transporter [Operophtera brumata]
MEMGLFCIAMTVYYATNLNPTFSGMKTHDTLSSVFEFIGMLVFGMSCSGVVLPVENHMKDPKKFTLAVPIILKGLIAFMIFITHALNFWVPFSLMFYYIKQRHSEKRIVMWECIYRAIFVTGIAVSAIIFPNINALMGFLGTFCLANMAIIWPCIINLLVIWHRPGLGRCNWRLWMNILLILVGLVIFVCGSFVNGRNLIKIMRTL